MVFGCERCPRLFVCTRFVWYDCTVDRGHTFNKINTLEPCSH